MEIKRSGGKVRSSQPRRNRDLPHDYRFARAKQLPGRDYPTPSLYPDQGHRSIWRASSKTERYSLDFQPSRLGLDVSCQDQRNQDDIMVPRTRSTPHIVTQCPGTVHTNG
jgi:hypothetical protein